MRGERDGDEQNAMKLSRRSFLGGASLTAALASSGCVGAGGGAASYLAQVVDARHDNTVFFWLDAALQQVRDQRVPPPRAAYSLAMPLAAGFLAANGVAGAYGEAFGVGEGPADADPEVAYGVAFRVAAAETFQQPFLFERNAFLNRFPDGPAKSRGAEWGRRVGMHVVRMRTNDGSEASEVNYYLGRYPRRHDALRWTPTGPFYGASPGPAFGSFSRGLYPGQGRITPWTMTSGAQFRADPFHDPRSPAFAEEFDLIRRLGAADSDVRSDDESDIALFWEDGPWGITPPGHFLLIAAQVLQDRDLSFVDLARAFALLGMTQCDASINAWDNKYAYDIIRPETAIRSRAPKFANADPRVAADPRWRSYIPTPEFPAYTSGHSTFGAAATALTALIYGSDEVAFSHASPDQVLWPQIAGKTRSWTRLSEAAEENGMSRLYGGVHWRADHDAAMAAGRAIARQAFETTFPAKV